MATKPKCPNYLRDCFLFEAGLTKNMILFPHREWESESKAESMLFVGDQKFGDMHIYYPTLDGHLQRHNAGGKLQDTFRIRKANPFPDKNGNEVKYLMNGNICAFFPPEMIEAYRKKREIEVLIITEGEKKAFVACKNGFDCIGISGIWCYKPKEDKESGQQEDLLPEIKEFLKVCNVKRVVLLHDSDSLDMTDFTKSKNANKPATDRPMGFCNSARRCFELVVQQGVKFSFSYINPHISETGKKYGLDDLILEFETYDQRVLLDFFESVKEGKSTAYFCTKNITFNKEVFWYDIWHLNDATEFYRYHKQKLKHLTEFRFKHLRYKINSAEDKIEEIKSYDREAVWIDDGRYCGYDIKQNKRVFTNFTMNVLFLLKSSTNPKRIVSFKNIIGQECIKELTMDDLVSVSNFRKKLISDGSYIYKGDMYELLNLQEMLFKEEQVATEITSLGWQRHYNFYAWSNGISSDGKFYPIDEYGIVLFQDKRFYFPAFSSLHEESDIQFENERNFRHFPDSEISFESWMVRFVKVYKENGTIGICYFVASLFRDLIYPVYKEFPLLNLFGQKGSGKSTMAKSLMSLFGVPQNALNIESGTSTSKAIQRKQAQFRNALVWIDEYKNSIDPKSVAMLKGLYDGVGYERAQTSQDNKTMNTPVLSSTILSGQDMPTIDPALFRRVILLMFKSNEFKEEESKNYDELKAVEKRGLTSITISILQHRDKIADKYHEEFKYWNSKLKKDFQTKQVVESIMKNAAMVLAPMSILLDAGVFDLKDSPIQFTKHQLYTNFYECIERHRNLMNDNQEISVFWETVETLFEEGLISAEKGHFRFVEDCIAIRYTPVYSAYSEKYRKVHGRAGLDKQTLLNYLKGSSYFRGNKDAIRFEGVGSPTSGFLFMYKELGISLEKGLPSGAQNNPLLKESIDAHKPGIVMNHPAEQSEFPY
jgi:hypothetical protein